jgi:hypothetical protein
LPCFCSLLCCSLVFLFLVLPRREPRPERSPASPEGELLGRSAGRGPRRRLRRAGLRRFLYLALGMPPRMVRRRLPVEAALRRHFLNSRRPGLRVLRLGLVACLDPLDAFKDARRLSFLTAGAQDVGQTLERGGNPGIIWAEGFFPD